MSDRNTFRIAVRKFGPFEVSIQKQWDSFCAATGCGLKLEMEALDLHPLHESLFEQGGLKNGAWDVVFLNTDWLAEAEAAGALLDLSPYIQKNAPQDYPQGWSESLLRFQRFGEKVIGLPYHDGPECLIYRKDLFESAEEQAAFRAKYGRELQLPETWEQFREVAQFFTRPEKNLYGTAFAAYPDGHNTVYDFSLQLWTRGGELFDEAGQMRIDSAEAQAGLEYYRSLLKDSSAVHPRCREFDSVKSGFAFAAGEIALMINWFGFAVMGETLPESRVKGCVNIAPLPAAPGKASASLNVYWLLGIASGSAHAQVAYDFIRHAVSAEQDKQLTLEGATGCRKSTWHDPEVNRVIPFYHRLETLHHNARELPRLVQWAQLSTVIDGLMTETINSERPVSEIAAEYQKKADALLQSA